MPYFKQFLKLYTQVLKIVNDNFLLSGLFCSLLTVFVSLDAKEMGLEIT